MKAVMTAAERRRTMTCSSKTMTPAAGKCAVSYYVAEALWFEGSFWYTYFYTHTERRPV